MKASKSDSQLLLGCIAGLSIIFNIARKIYIIYNNFINNKEVNTSLLFSFAISQTQTLLSHLIILINSNTDNLDRVFPQNVGFFAPLFVRSLFLASIACLMRVTSAPPT